MWNVASLERPISERYHLSMLEYMDVPLYFSAYRL